MRRPGITSGVAIGAVLLVQAAALPAQPRLDGQSLWQIMPAKVPTDVLSLRSKEFVVKQKLLPIGLAVLTSEAVVKGGKVRLPAGTQLIRIGYETRTTYCDATRYGKKANSGRIACFNDTNRDGRFESFFMVFSETSAIISINPAFLSARAEPMDPAGYRVEWPEAFSQDLFVGIQRRNFFNIYSRESFMIVFGNAQHTQEITAPIQFKNSEMPIDLTVMGARFSALSENDGAMQIKVHATMPQQPFGIVRTTTYRF